MAGEVKVRGASWTPTWVQRGLRSPAWTKGIGFFPETPVWSPAGNPVILACRTKQRDRLPCKTRGGK